MRESAKSRSSLKTLLKVKGKNVSSWSSSNKSKSSLRSVKRAKRENQKFDQRKLNSRRTLKSVRNAKNIRNKEKEFAKKNLKIIQDKSHASLQSVRRAKLEKKVDRMANEVEKAYKTPNPRSSETIRAIPKSTTSSTKSSSPEKGKERSHWAKHGSKYAAGAVIGSAALRMSMRPKAKKETTAKQSNTQKGRKK